MIKSFFKLILILLVIAIGAIAISIYLIAEDTALVSSSKALSEADIEKLRNIIKDNKPLAVVNSSKKKLALTTQQINQLLGYGSGQLNNSLRARVVTEKSRFYLKASYVLPENPVSKFLNVSAYVRMQHAKHFVIEELKLGKLKIPRLLVTIAEPWLLEKLQSRYDKHFRLWKYLRRINVSEDGVTVYYRLERSDLAELKQLGRKILVNNDMKQNVLAYVAEMERILGTLPGNKQSLTRLMAPMFIFTEQRSQTSKKPVEENRMAMLVMGAYMMGRNPAKYISDEPVKPFKNINFTLRDRNDLPKHYLISSAINAVSGTAWSNAIGLEKELNDSDGGSGFSFVDLMADIAGNKLAQAALDENKAKKLQAKMALLTSEDSIIGEITGLAEGLTATEFRLEYGNTNSDEYITVVREIERRLFQCDAYR